PTACSNPGDDQVVSRSVSYDGATVGSTWSYTRTGTIGQRTVTVTYPELNLEVHQFDSVGREVTVKFEKPDQTVTKTVTTVPFPSGAPNTVTTSIDGASQTRTLTYDSWNHI